MKFTFAFALLIFSLSLTAQTNSDLRSNPNAHTFDTTEPTGTPSSVNQQREEDSRSERNNRGGNRPGTTETKSGKKTNPGTSTTPAPATTAPAAP